MTEEGGLKQFGWDGPRVDGDKGTIAARRVGVEGLCDELLSGPAFALDKDGRPRGRDLHDNVEEAQHWLAFADDVFEAVALLEGATKKGDLGLGAAAADGGADVEDEFLIVPGLLDEVVGAGAYGFDDVADCAVSRDHDDGELRSQLNNAWQQIEAALAGKGEIEQEQIELLAREEIEA